MEKNVALVLSSGGARGLAHIGAIEELESRGYKITSIAGCSMGSLVGGVYAAGKLTEFREWMKTINRKKMMELTDFSLSLNHVAKGTRIIEAIMEFVPDMPIEDLPIPYCAAAEGAHLAAYLFHGLGREELALLDVDATSRLGGGLQELRLAAEESGNLQHIGIVGGEARLLVGVDVSGHDYEAQSKREEQLSERRRRQRPLASKVIEKLTPDNINFNHYTMLSRVSSIMIRQNSILMTQLTAPDVLIDIQMSRYDSFDFDKSERLIAIGRKKAQETINEYETKIL